MKRISVPNDCMRKTLTDLNVRAEQANDIIALFEVVDAGDVDVLVMPVLSFNHSRQLSRKEVLKTFFTKLFREMKFSFPFEIFAG